MTGAPQCSVCGELVQPRMSKHDLTRKQGGYDHTSGSWDCGGVACRSESPLRVELLELIDGVPIVRMLPKKQKDEPLRRGRLYPGGPLIEVDRITAGAMYVHRIYDPPLIREVGREELDAAVATLHKVLETGTPSEVYRLARSAFHAAGEYRQIVIRRGPVEPGISPASIIYPE